MPWRVNILTFLRYFASIPDVYGGVGARSPFWQRGGQVAKKRPEDPIRNLPKCFTFRHIEDS